jgi:hypothetical protein
VVRHARDRLRPAQGQRRQKRRSPGISPSRPKAVLVHDRVNLVMPATDGRTAGELDRSSKSAGEIAALWPYLRNRMEPAYAETEPYAAD